MMKKVTQVIRFRMRKFLLSAICALAGVAVLVAPAGAAPADDETVFLEMVNEARQSAGLSPLTRDLELEQEARSWSQVMADEERMFHAPWTTIVNGRDHWAWMAENVGVGPLDVDVLFDAFMASPPHRESVMRPYGRLVGIGVVYQDDRMWMTHRFLEPSFPVIGLWFDRPKP